MVSYPISIARKSYRGADPKKRAKVDQHNQDVNDLELFINGLLKNQVEEIKTYSWASIASASGMSKDFVREVGFSIDCGHNGFTAKRLK